MTAATLILAVPAILVAAFDRGGRWSSSIVRGWAHVVLALAGVKVDVEGAENLPSAGAHVYVSTHQSMLDVPALFSVLPARTRFLAKRELFRVPLFGQAIRMLGFVPIDREDTRSAVRSLDALAGLVAERPVLVFPEGTRSPDGALLPFKRGAFALAHQLQLPVVPLACLGGHRCMPAHQRIVRPGRMVVRIGRVIAPGGPAHASRAALMGAAREEIERLATARVP